MDPLAPDVIEVRGGVERLSGLLHRDVVAFAGAQSPSDYGLRCAGSLARQIAAAGVTVAICGDELGAAAHAGALQAGGVTIVAGSRRKPEQLAGHCALALLADLMIVVDADEQPSSLSIADVAESRSAAIGVVPGPIDSPGSYVSNQLIAEGALVICSAEDALDALGGVGGRRRRRARERRSSKPRRDAKSTGSAEAKLPEPHPTPHAPEPELEPRLEGVLERVRGGEDTLAKLCLGASDCDEPALALTELELTGLLQRTPDGRYLPSAAGHLR
jgi:predicted Rossmann fold nucleotide-binding protein DprA/Smf involved in DNA uptake